MDRREMHHQAMLRELGAAYYQAVHGQGSAANVASAVQAVEKADAETTAGPGDSGSPAASGPAHRAKRWRVCDVMTAPAVSVTEHTSYKQIARLLSEHRLSALPVLSRGGQVIGVVSEADLLHKQERQHAARPAGMSWRLHRKAAAKARARNAGQLMTSPAVTIHPDAGRVGGPPAQPPSPAAPAGRGLRRPSAGYRKPPRPAQRVPAARQGDRRGGARGARRCAAG
jgi:hypothetical protein